MKRFGRLPIFSCTRRHQALHAMAPVLCLMMACRVLSDRGMKKGMRRRREEYEKEKKNVSGNSNHKSSFARLVNRSRKQLSSNTATVYCAWTKISVGRRTVATKRMLSDVPRSTSLLRVIAINVTYSVSRWVLCDALLC